MLFLIARGLVIVIIPAAVFSGSSFRQMMRVGKLPSIESGAPVLTVLEMCVFDGGGHHGHLSVVLMLVISGTYSSQLEFSKSYKK